MTMITLQDITNALLDNNGKITLSNKSFLDNLSLEQNISSHELVDQFIDAIIKLNENSAVTEVEVTLKNTDIADVKKDDIYYGVSALCRLLKDSTKLTKLSLPNNNLRPENLSKFSDILASNQTLKTLDLSSNVIGPDKLGQIIVAVGHVKSLESLCIGDSEDKITDQLADIIIPIMEKNDKLVDIEVKNWRSSISADKMNDIKVLSLINKSQTSQLLDLKDLNINPFLINRIFRDNAFESLLLDNSGINDDTMFLICKKLRDSDCSLKEIRLPNNNDITTRGLMALASAIEKQGTFEDKTNCLVRVDIRGINLMEDAAKVFLNALKSNPKINRFQYNEPTNEDPITKATSLATTDLMSSNPQIRSEIAAQEADENSFHNDISYLDRKRRAEEVELLKIGRDGFENLDKYFLQFSQSLMAEITPHIEDYTRTSTGKTLRKRGADIALDGLETVARLVDGIELSPLTGAVEIDGLSNSMQIAIDSARGFRNQDRVEQSESTHDNLESKNQLSPKITDAVNLIARGLIISYRPQLEKIDPKATKGAFNIMAKAIVGQMAKDKNYANIPSVLDRAMTALYNGIAANDIFPDGVFPYKHHLRTKNPAEDKNWNLYSMIRRSGVTAFNYTGDQNEPVEQIDMVRNDGGKGYRPSLGLGSCIGDDNSGSNTEEGRRLSSKNKYGNHYGVSHHKVINDFYEPCDMTRTLTTEILPNSPAASSLPPVPPTADLSSSTPNVSTVCHPRSGARITGEGYTLDL